MIYFLTTRISAQVGSSKPGTTGQLTAAVQVGSIYTITSKVARANSAGS